MLIFVVSKNKLGETGSSSLRKNQSDKRPHLLDRVIDVSVCSLSYILDFLPLEKFNYIEHIKTDNEGADAEVIKSLGDKIQKVIYINSEIKHLTFEERSDFVEYMVNQDFELFDMTPQEFFFKNKRYLNVIKEKEIKLMFAGT